MENKLSKLAILAPLVGLIGGWKFFMFAIYAGLFVYPIYDAQGMYQGDEQIIRPATYLFLSGIVIFGLLALYGQRLALRARSLAGVDDGLARAAHRFTNFAVIVALAGGAFFAIGNFLGAFNTYIDREENLTVRLFDVYIPILLATGLVVYIILRAFVFRKQVVKGAKKEGMSESEKALGLGYAVPIIATAIAIIFGLAVYDVTRTDLEVWVWVIIQVIIVSGILLGTRFSTKARSAKAAAPRARATLAAGAANLNFVLSIVFGVTVSIMSFGFGAAGIEKLRVYPPYEEPAPGEEFTAIWSWTVAPLSVSWFIEQMLPAIVLLVLAAAGTYLSITERNKVALVAKKPTTPSSKKVAKAPAKKATRSKTTSSKSKTTTAKRPKAKNK
jgi:heme/copper-type cytochrome/quinol oxidase subunit 2